jgi:hypothetical protein
MLAFYQNAVQQMDALEDCLKSGRIISCLCLLYSLIDVTASLERRPPEGTKAAFVRWVEENMLKRQPLSCSALELYAARCGVLHTFTPDSDLSRDGLARTIVYAWGNARAEDLAEAGRRLGRNDVAIHIADLLACFRAGLDAYLEGVVHDSGRLRSIEQQATPWFIHMHQEIVNRFLSVPQ